jgi:hypothetical protein
MRLDQSIHSLREARERLELFPARFVHQRSIVFKQIARVIADSAERLLEVVRRGMRKGASSVLLRANSALIRSSSSARSTLTLT